MNPPHCVYTLCLSQSTTAANYDGIELKPDMFEDYLLNHVGFSCVESLPTAKHDAKGSKY